MPANVPWPEKNGTRLGFVGRLSLKEIHDKHSISWLPKDGALLFFYDYEQQPWGFDPEDRGSAAVLLVPDVTEPISQGKNEADSSPAMCEHQNIGFQRIDVLPWIFSASVETLGLTDEAGDHYADMMDRRYGENPKHQVTGFPYIVQDSMELECQLASNGIDCGGESGDEDPRVEQLKAGASNWRLLLQVDTDEDLKIMWGDMGLIYFWVEEQKAKAGDFSNIWVILQCS